MSGKRLNYAPMHNFQLGKRKSAVPAKLTADDGRFSELFHFALSLKKALTPERVAQMT